MSAYPINELHERIHREAELGKAAWAASFAVELESAARMDERAKVLAEVTPLLKRLGTWRKSVQRRLQTARSPAAEFSLAKSYDAYVKKVTP